MSDLSGARVLVTGAASGIGAALVRRLAGGGAAVIAMDRDGDALAELPAAARIVGDVADAALWAAADLAGLTHAAINAGISRGGVPIADLPFDAWRAVLATNLDGAFLSLSAALRAIRATGRGGAVTLTASASGLRAAPGIAAYAASKAALIQLARVAALEGAAERIRVNAIAPAGVETPMWSDQPFFRELAAAQGGEAGAYAALAAQGQPLGRFATADEAAGQIAWLLSDAAATITGACLVADGGYTL